MNRRKKTSIDAIRGTITSIQITDIASQGRTKIDSGSTTPSRVHLVPNFIDFSAKPRFSLLQKK